MLKQTSQHTRNLIDTSISNSNTDSDQSSLSEEFSQNTISRKEAEQPQEHESAATSHPLSKSSKSASSIITNSSHSQPSLSSSPSSQISINFLLPRPPPPILRSSNIDGNTDPISSEAKPNDDNDLSVHNKENELTKNDLMQIDEEIQTDVRRSTRPRAKTKRIYSPEPIGRPTYATAKKKKTLKKIL